MLDNWSLIYSILFLESFLLCGFLTILMVRLSIKWGIVDRPGYRKIHSSPIPLLGGIGIFLSFSLILLGHWGLLYWGDSFGLENLQFHLINFNESTIGEHLIPVTIGAVVIVVLGFIDDIHPLSPKEKLIGQSIVALILIGSGIRLDLFIEPILNTVPLFKSLDSETFHLLTITISASATLFWMVLIMNAQNFLDNMDGLCAGISVIAAISFTLCIAPQGEYYLGAILIIFAGSLAGFLVHNLNPARIFMGDSGSMFCGYLLATTAVLGTFYNPSFPSRVAIVAPVLALSIPLFDITSVVYIRWRSGENIMKGDARHFSHRLVELGMSPNQAVGFICLIASITGIGGALLLQVSQMATLAILGQLLGIFALIVLLMKAKRRV